MPRKKPTIPEQIRTARERAGFSQQALGEAMGFAGATAQTVVAHFENGTRTPAIKHLEAIAKATGHAFTVGVCTK